MPDNPGVIASGTGNARVAPTQGRKPRRGKVFVGTIKIPFSASYTPDR